VIFVLGSAIAAIAPSIEIMILGCIIQAVGGAAGMVLNRAIIRDLYDRDTSARLMAYMITALVIVPMISLLIDGLLNDAFNWRAIFILAVWLACWHCRKFQRPLSDAQRFSRSGA
jgi:DHA1 family bicyclomycin/chloramphenicol resistance-like MFS transporter